MLELWEWVKDDYSNFKTTATLFGTLLFVLGIVAKTFFSEWIKSPFSKKLETFKSELVEKIEDLKVQNQKDYFNFESFHKKRHETYPELFRLVETALAHMNSLRNYKRKIALDDLSKEDIEQYCSIMEFKPGDKKFAVQNWDSDRPAALVHIRNVEETIEYNKAELAWHDANDYAVFNELFFSNDVAKETREILNKMKRYWAYLDPFYKGMKEAEEEIATFKMLIEGQRINWKELLKKELRPLQEKELQPVHETKNLV